MTTALENASILDGPPLGFGDGFGPAAFGFGDFGGVHGGLEFAVHFPLVGDFVGVFPEADAETGEVGRTESGGFVDLGADDGDAGDIRLELHEEIIDGGAAIDAEFFDFDAGIGLHGLEDIHGLESDAFEGGAGNMAGVGAAGDAEDGAASGLIPMGGTEADEGWNEINAGTIGDACGEGFDIGGAADDAKAIAKPLDDGAGDKDAALECVGGFIPDFPADGGEEIVLGRDRFVAGVEDHKSAGAVGVLEHAGLKTHLAEERGLLIASDAGDGDGGVEELVGGLAINFAGGADFRKQAAGDIEELEEFVIPLQSVNIKEEGAAGVADISDVQFAAGKIPDEPGIDGAEGELAGFGQIASAGDVIEEPLDFRSGEIGIENEAGFFLEFFGEVAGFEVVAGLGGAAVLPDNGVVDGLAGFAIPDDGGFALVGDADAGDVGKLEAGLGERFGDDTGLGGPDFIGVVLDPAGLREMLGKLALSSAPNRAVAIENNGA